MLAPGKCTWRAEGCLGISVRWGVSKKKRLMIAVGEDEGLALDLDLDLGTVFRRCENGHGFLWSVCVCVSLCAVGGFFLVFSTILLHLYV